MELIRNLLGSDKEAEPVAMPATFAGRFLIECAIANGGPSVVWRATEVATGAPVALKFFSPRLVREPRDLASAQALVAAVQHVQHTRVVAPKEVVLSGRYAAFVTPWVEGPTLRQMLYARPTRFFEVEDFRRLLRALIDALEAAHVQGVVHGALTPDVVLQNGGELRVVGFGVNAWLREQWRRHGRVLAREEASPYLSPAQERGEPSRATDDVFALGVMLYELLSGTSPRGAWWNRQGLPITMARQRRKNGTQGESIPITWERVVRRCLGARERGRLGSMRELRSRLELGAPGTPPAPVMMPLPPRPMNPAPPQVKARNPAPPVPPPAAAREEIPPPDFSGVPGASPPPQQQPERETIPPAAATAAAAGADAPAYASVPQGHFDPFAGVPRAAPPPARPPLRGDVPFPAAPGSARAAARPVAADSVVLRGLFAMVAMVTIAVGGWLAWQVYLRNEGVRQWVAEARALFTDTGEELPEPEPETAAAPDARTPEPDSPPAAVKDAATDVVAAAPEPAAPTAEVAKPAPEPPAMPAPGSIEIRSDPPGARVLLAGEAKQAAPCVLETLEPGSHPIEVLLEGYTPFVTLVDVKSGERALVEARLERLSGGLHIESDPVGAKFSVRPFSGDGPSQDGETPATLRLPTGRYVVHLRQGAVSRSHIVDVNAQRPAIARASFPPPPGNNSNTTTAAANEASATRVPPVRSDTPRSSPPPLTASINLAGSLAPVPEHITSVLTPPSPREAARSRAPEPREATAPSTTPPAKPPTAEASPARATSLPATPADENGQAKANEPTVAPASGPPLDGGIFELGNVDVQPRLIERVDPRVPRRGFWGTSTGRIELVVVIDRMGRVASAAVHSTTDESLVVPSLQAVRSWRFSPATKGGQPVPVRVSVPLVFKSS